MLFQSPLIRRVVTIPLIVIAFIIVTSLAPIIALLAVAVDVGVWLRRRRPWTWTRALSFGWAYLLAETVTLPLLGLSGLLPRRQRIAFTYRLQAVWARWLIGTVTRLFRLRMAASGLDQIPPGPVLILSRHASLIDTLLPAHFIARPHSMRVRYVLKQQLLLDPALDIAGNRLPNAFISRGSGDARADRAAIAALTSAAGPNDAVLIYPEGTRFSDEKRDQIRQRYTERGGPLAARARELDRVLPPQPGGVLTMLDNSDCDVVLMAHRGLEGFARVADIIAGDLVGTEVAVQFRRVPRADIPDSRSERVNWLFNEWSAIDDWIVQGSR